MAVQTLARMAERACKQNIAVIDDLGDAEYRVVKPLLLICTPKQLYNFEQTSQQIIGHDAEIWRAFIQRDIERWKMEMQEPKDPRGWYKLYRRLLKDQKLRIIRDEAHLRSTIDGMKEEKAAHTSRQVELDIVKPPTGVTVAREIIRASPYMKRSLKDQRGTRDFQPDIVRWQKETGQLNPATSRHGSKDPHQHKSKPVSKLAAIRKEAAAISRITKPLGGQAIFRSPVRKPATPTGQPSGGYHQPIASLPSHQHKASSPPSRKRPVSDLEKTRVDDGLDHREKKLKLSKENLSEPSRLSSPAMTTSTAKTISKTFGSQDTEVPNDNIAQSAYPSVTNNDEKEPIDSHTQQSTVPKSAEHTKPMIRIRKQPVNIFMPAKKQRVH